MKRNYHQLMRLLSVLIVGVAFVILLIRQGVIPRFWEQTQQAMATAEPAAETPEDVETVVIPPPSDTQTEPEQAPEPESDGQDTSEEQAAQEQTVQEQPQPKEEPSPQEQLENYLADDPRTPVQAKGIFITGAVAGTKNTMPELTRLVEDSSLNAMVIDVKNDAGEVTYQMELPLAQEIGAPVRYVADMPALVQQLKEQGIYLIARIVAFKDPVLAENKPEYAVKNADGSVFYDNNGLAWVNPYREEVWDYLIDLGREAAALGFDEIQYDYIRFSTAKGIAEADFGEAAEGRTRQDAIGGFLTKAYETLAPLGVYVSVDVFGTIICNEADGRLIGQDYVEMAKHCDYICPMVYPSHYVNNAYGIAVPDADPYALIYASVADGEQRLAEAAKQEPQAHFAKQRPWLQAFTATWVDGHIPYRGAQLQAQIRGAADAGVEEWLLWNASNNYKNVQSGLL